MQPLLFLLIGASLLSAQIPGTFRQINIDCGGWFTGIVQHSTGRLYGRTDVGGLYRSDTNGDSWTFLSGDFTHRGGLSVQGIAVANQDPDTIYQACGVSYFPDDPDRGIWKSTDAGATWRQVKANLNFSGNDDARHGGECLLIHPADDQEIWAGTRSQGLWKSTDAGQSWIQIAGDTFKDLVILGITIHTNFPNQLWVATEGGLWISWDRGQTWEKEFASGVIFRSVRKPDGSGFVIGGKYNPNSPTDTKLWHLTKDDWSKPGEITSTDRWPNYLAAFEKIKKYQPVDLAGALGLLRDGSLITAGFFRDPAISADHGLTFQILPPTVIGKLPVWALEDSKNHQGGWNQIIQDVKVDTRFFSTGGYGPSRSEDSAKTWEYITRGIGEAVTWRSIFHPTDPNLIIIPSADHGLTTIHDGGDSGKSIGTISRLFPWPGDILTYAHSARAHEKEIIALGGAPLKGEARIWQSLDKGASWKIVPPHGYPQKRGFEWTEMATDLKDPNDILALMGGPIGPEGGGIYRSRDGGKSFTQSPLPAKTTGIHAGSEFVWDTRLLADGGRANRRYLSIKDCGIFRSDDRGDSWQEIRPAGLPTTSGWLGIDRKVANRIWFASFDGLHRSDNAGDAWLRIADFKNASDVDAVDGRVAVIGKMTDDDFYKIYYSADNGSTWREITRKGDRFGNSTSVAVDPHRPGQVWISTSGRSTAIFTPTE